MTARDHAVVNPIKNRGLLFATQKFNQSTNIDLRVTIICHGQHMSAHIILVGGWPTPLKNDGVKVSWDDEIPNMMGNIKAMFQTTSH